jgi:hypothetical protein
MRFHTRCIGMHKSLNGKELMYTFTTGLHMMFCGFILCTKLCIRWVYMYMYPSACWSICIYSQLYSIFQNVL